MKDSNLQRIRDVQAMMREIIDRVKSGNLSREEIAQQEQKYFQLKAYLNTLQRRQGKKFSQSSRRIFTKTVRKVQPARLQFLQNKITQEERQELQRQQEVAGRVRYIPQRQEIFLDTGDDVEMLPTGETTAVQVSELDMLGDGVEDPPVMGLDALGVFEEQEETKRQQKPRGIDELAEF